mmetsp:Transcript_17184/g.29586  ORF Transcript_17184/g.29586 Transcript_17184/m.29586 type:complete len:178 (+) Transcript_17184:578-1111(+)
MAIGMNDPSAIATVDFALSKSSSLVMLGTMFWYVREDRIKGRAAAIAVEKPAGLVPGASNVPIGSDICAILGKSKLAKLVKSTIAAAFAIDARPVLVWVNEKAAIIAVKAVAPTMGSKPSPGKVLANKEPAWTVPNARKQLLLMREAPAMTVPATSDFKASSTKSLKLLGNSQPCDS